MMWFVYMHVHVYRGTYIYPVPACVCGCECVCTQEHMCVRMRACVHACVRVRACMCIDQRTTLGIQVSSFFRLHPSFLETGSLTSLRLTK